MCLLGSVTTLVSSLFRLPVKMRKMPGRWFSGAKRWTDGDTVAFHWHDVLGLGGGQGFSSGQELGRIRLVRDDRRNAER